MRRSVSISQIAQMNLFGRLRSPVDRAPVEPLPTEVLATLINDLYSVLVSFVIGATTAALVGGIAAWRTGSPWLTGLTVGTMVVAAARLLITIAYRKDKRALGGDAAAVRCWERWYAFGASAYAACLGGLCFVAFAFTDDPISHLLLNANAVGYTAGATARNSSRPRIAVAQLSLILLPITIGSALHGGSTYVVLSGITFLYYLATIEIAQYLAGNRVRLLLATRALAEQNFRFDTALANMPHGLCPAPAVGLEQAVLRPLRDCTGSAVTGHHREGDDRAERGPRQSSGSESGRHGCRV